MAFFGELRGDLSPRSRLAKMKPEFDRRLESNKNVFNINISRMKPISKEHKESMATYSERVQNISKTRKPQEAREDRSLEVKAHKISKKYKFRETLPDRKILSLEELVGRRKMLRERPQSLDEVTSRKENFRRRHDLSQARTPRGMTFLPSLPSVKPQKNLKVSFVNASDLYDFVDYSIRQPSFKKQPLGHIRVRDSLGETQRENNPPLRRTEQVHDPQDLGLRKSQSKSGQTDNLGARVLPPLVIYIKERDQNDNSELDYRSACDKMQLRNIQGEATHLPTNQMEQLKIRPKRAKRMRLHKSGLDSIPETDRDLKREASLSNSFRWRSSQQPLYLPRQQCSPETSVGTDCSVVEKCVNLQKDVRVGMKLRPHSDPQTDDELNDDYDDDDFEDDHGFYEEDSFSSVGDDESNSQNRTSNHKHKSEIT